MDLTIDQLIKNCNYYNNIKNYDAMINCYLNAETSLTHLYFEPCR